jgi:hypothetical protein
MKHLKKEETLMVVIIYALIWLLAAASAGLLYFTGNFNDLTMTVFGFIFSTLVFMGMIAVLPWWVDKQYSWKY